MELLVKNVDINIGEALLYSLVSILIVFLILFLITVIVGLFKKLKLEDKVEEAKPQPSLKEERRQTKIEDIKDDDMMVAVLIATIDYANEIKEDVHLVSVREL